MRIRAGTPGRIFSDTSRGIERVKLLKKIPVGTSFPVLGGISAGALGRILSTISGDIPGGTHGGAPRGFLGGDPRDRTPAGIPGEILI